ncbi:hypothetical protein HXX76_008384 [Chlamydomonas incerta]|uniref:Anaphase-promoting complex subunit 4 WD40 domain-containing protein n=1 Tax=Chlamydomonas incerta TaxID=51695 RepID=A0A835W131_CHLIN|nr:hypothetical protein HXX76_008384 [Chlamydomonas incerta]|eukprot:KAG2433318.1 hypothetical protein HXX76_008384 [Chlamydomonas incerta]
MGCAASTQRPDVALPARRPWRADSNPHAKTAGTDDRQAEPATPVQETEQPEDPLETTRLGITLRGLRKLRQTLEDHFGVDQFATLTTGDCKSLWVESVTKARRCRLVQFEGIVDPADVAPPLYFISHAWKNKLALLLDSVERFLAAASDTTCVWIDILSVNQHSDTLAQKNDVAAFSDVVQVCSGGTLVVMDVANCNPATRAWCIFEWAHTLGAHGPDGLHLALEDPADRQSIYGDLDVRRAECFFEGDKVFIMGQVDKYHGSADAFNAKLRLQLLLEPLSYAVDVRRLCRRAAEGGGGEPEAGGGAGAGEGGKEDGAGGVGAWDWTALEVWLKPGGGGGGGGGGEADAKPARALCIVAGAGEGKSTISALLCAATASAAAAAAGADAGPDGRLPSGGAPAGAVAAAHFCKYNDARRLEPVRIIKSLAFQLALKLPAVCAALLQLDAGVVSQISDEAKAFDLLLLKPLKAHFEAVAGAGAAAAGAPAAAPGAGAAAEPPGSGANKGPESSAAAPAAGGSSGSSVGAAEVVLLLDALDEADPPPLAAAGTAADAAATSAPAVTGNRTLHLLTSLLVQLPPSVRFIVTTRPDAAAGQVVPALERTFGAGGPAAGGVALLRPGDFRQKAKAAAAGDAHAAAAQPSSSSAHEAASGAGSSGSGGGASGGGGGVLVYRAVAGGCLPPDEAAAALAAAARVPPTLSDLYGLYSRIWGRSVLAGGPHSTAGGGAAASAASASEAAAARRLLCVLLAAQEPLPHSLLQQMGLGGGGTLAALPGWGLLFFLDEHHVHTLHKSVVDWLSDPKASGPFAVNAAAGHALLGSHLAALRHSVTGGGGGSSQGARGKESGAKSSGGGGASASAAGRYTLRYLVTHLAAAAAAESGGAVAGAVSAPASGAAVNDPAAALTPSFVLLEDVLSDLRFLGAALRARATPGIIAALGTRLPRHLLSTGRGLAGDVLRSLRTWLQDMEAAVAQATAAGSSSSKSGAGGGGGGSSSVGEEAVLAAALRAPTSTALYGLAAGGWARQLGGAVAAWSAARVMPPVESWPAFEGVLRGHNGGVMSMSFAPDSRQLVSCAQDGTVRAWDVATGAAAAVLRGGHQCNVLCVAWSPAGGGGALIAAAYEDCNVDVWDAATGQRLRSIKHPGKAVGCAWAPNGRLLATCHEPPPPPPAPAPDAAAAAAADGAGAKEGQPLTAGGAEPAKQEEPKVVAVWNALTGQRVGELAGAPPRSTHLAWSDCDRWLAVAGMKKIAVWDMRSPGASGIDANGGDDGGAAFTAPPGWSAPAAVLEGHEERVTVVAWRPRGGGGGGSGPPQLASGDVYGVLRLWDVAAGAATVELFKVHDPQVSAAVGPELMGLAYSPDGRQLASCGPWDRAVKLWCTATGSCLAVLGGHLGPVANVAWSPDGALLASGDWLRTVRVWSVAAAQADEPALRGAQQEQQRQQKLRLQQEQKRERERAAAARVGGEAGAAEAAAAAEEQDEAEEDEAADEADGHRHTDRVTAVAWAPVALPLAPPPPPSGGGAGAATGAAPLGSLPLLASSSVDCTIRLWDHRTGTSLAVLHGHTNAIDTVGWRQDAARLASGSWDKNVRVWAVEAGAAAAGSGAGGAASVTTPAAKASAEAAQTGAVSARCVATLRGHTNRVGAVCWLPPAGDVLATAGMDGDIRLWRRRQAQASAGCSTAAGAEAAGLAAGAGGAAGAAAEPDDEEPRECFEVLKGHANRVCALSASPDGRRLASGGIEKEIRVWSFFEGGGDEGSPGEAAAAPPPNGAASGAWRCTAVLPVGDMMDAVVWSPCGRYIACGTWGKEVQLWAERAGADEGTAAAADPGPPAEGTPLDADQQQQQQLAAWSCVRKIVAGSYVHGLAWRADSTQLAGSCNDKAVRVWDVESGASLAVLHGHTDVAHCVTWWGAGQQHLLASGSSDLTVRVWHRQEATEGGF